jgi:hypothetical protein
MILVKSKVMNFDHKRTSVAYRFEHFFCSKLQVTSIYVHNQAVHLLYFSLFIIPTCI